MKFSVPLFMGLLLLLNLCSILRNSILGNFASRLVSHPQCPKEGLRYASNKELLEGEHPSPQPTDHNVLNGKYLGGLLSAEFDESSCVSRYQSNLYRRRQPRQPSSHLISRLRSYESLLKKCGPNTELYKKTSENLKSGGNNNSELSCKYVIWIPFEGLGNRILTLASTFLYALLTDRVLLIGEGAQVQDLFCEPFPEVSWLLPKDFPIVNIFSTFHRKSVHSHGNLAKNNVVTNSMLPPFVYLHLAHDMDENDQLFFCDQDQTLLKNVPWLIVKSNQYFLPALFLIPSFQPQLNNLFPEKDTVFHHLGRYLFHPTNSVWGLITRYYEAYLAKSNEKIGIQIRVFQDGGNDTVKHVLDQILACTMNENLLPGINKKEPIIKRSEKQKKKAVTITSLRSGYYEEIRNTYLQYATVTGEAVAIHQPSHEEVQRTGNQMHDRKALAEVYLLSMSDKLVTSARSTFGYVAQSLGGLRPWILHTPYGGKAPDPPCQRASSMEPCFQFAPSVLACKKRKGIATENLAPHVQHCEDVSWGLKLFD